MRYGDSSYNRSSASKSLTVRDTTKPSKVVLTAPTNNTKTKSSTFKFTWRSASDLGGIKNYEIDGKHVDEAKPVLSDPRIQKEIEEFRRSMEL